MPYDFHSYIADMMLSAQKARNSGSVGSADMMDADLNFAVRDAQRAGQIGDDHEEFRNNVAHKIVERGGADLIDTLLPPKK